MIKSIARVGYAPIDPETGDYRSVVALESDEAGGRSFTATPRGEVKKIYADGRIAIAVDENDGYDITLELLDIIDDIEKDLYGVSVNSTTGAKAEFATGAVMPRFCLVLLENTVGGGGVISYYPNCQCAKRATRNSKTSEGSFDPQFPTIEITASPNDDGLVCYKVSGTTMPTTVPTFPASATANEAARSTQGSQSNSQE